MKRILVTGGSGFTGRHFIKSASARKYDVKVLESDLFDKIAVANEISFYQPDFVVHFAAISSQTNCNTYQTYNVNLMGTRNLLECLLLAKDYLKKVYLASSATVYGSAIDNTAIEEDLLPNPQSDYAMSKLAMEYLARSYYDALPIVIGRAFNYTGKFQTTNFLIPKIVEVFKSDRNIIELGNLDVRREFNDVRDFVNVSIELLERGVPNEIYNICSGRVLSINDILNKCREITGKSVTVVQNSELLRKNEPLVLGGSIRKLQSIIGNYDWINIQETLRWMLLSNARS